MNPKKFLLTVFAFVFSCLLIVYVPSEIFFNRAGNNLNATVSFANNKEEITFEKKFVDGAWWIYVYDNGRLTDRFPLEE
ncbi:MAG: hypothetical protein HGGPFJEG_02542 [Ignavibacteria bacterium]|nr:hypothetical protein [Ignavibacteria bacterium]